VADSKLTPDTTYDYRLAETVDNIGGVFGGWVSNLGDPTDVFTAPQTFTTPATKPPNGTSVSTSTCSGSTTLGCADTLFGCTGTYELLGELNGLVGADARAAASKSKARTVTVVLAKVGFHIAAGKKKTLRFHLTGSGRRFLKSHPHGPLIEQVSSRAGHGRMVTTRFAIHAAHSHG
jgi:hypothetical protein